MPFLPCILCGRRLEKRISRKNGKPYFVCDPCGIQLFIRKQRGIEKLEEVFKNIEKSEIPFRIHARHLNDIQALLKEMEGVKEEIEKLGTPLFMTDYKLEVRNSLKAQLDNLFSKLKKMGKEDDEESQIQSS
jgi:hypothetical protein